MIDFPVGYQRAHQLLVLKVLLLRLGGERVVGVEDDGLPRGDGALGLLEPKSKHDRRLAEPPGKRGLRFGTTFHVTFAGGI
jgi:hypothetical protein